MRIKPGRSSIVLLLSREGELDFYFFVVCNLFSNFLWLVVGTSVGRRLNMFFDGMGVCCWLDCSAFSGTLQCWIYLLLQSCVELAFVLAPSF